MFDNSHSFLRIALGFHNPNHAAALVCALLPLGWGWRGRLGRVLSGGLFAMLLLTQSRTGLLVAGLEVGAWWWTSRRGAARSASAPYRRRWLWIVPLVLAGLALWWMGPRLVLDDSILNRPKIWLAGLQFFAANPSGVGLGNSGTLASAFLLDGIPEVRTMISAHITLLAEFGWIVGWVWLAFIGLALCGVRECPRVGIAFTGLVLSGCSSTVFDWPVLFDFAEQGGLGMMNWVLSWSMFAMFMGFGVWLIAGVVRRTRRVRPTIAMLALAGVTVLGLRRVPGRPARGGTRLRRLRRRRRGAAGDRTELRLPLPRGGRIASLVPGEGRPRAERARAPAGPRVPRRRRVQDCLYTLRGRRHTSRLAPCADRRGVPESALYERDCRSVATVVTPCLRLSRTGNEGNVFVRCTTRSIGAF